MEAASSEAPAIEIRGLSKSYGSGETQVRALEGVDLDIERGGMVAIMGPSGSGKSTLLHLLGALDTPTEGTISLAGRRFEGLDDRELTLLRREGIGFVFQFFNLLPALTAEENVLLPALIAGRRDDAIRERAARLLERVGLTPRAGHLPSELSGGEQQRVSIARALLMEPELVLADEPTGNLDTRSEAQILELLGELNRRDGHTIVMVTHDPSAAAVAKRVIFLRDGRLAGEVEGGSAEAGDGPPRRVDGVRSYYALALRQLRTRRLRLLLTAAGIVLGVGMICGVLLLAATIQRTFTDLYDSVYGETDLVVSGSESSGSLPPSALDRARGDRRGRAGERHRLRGPVPDRRGRQGRRRAGVHAERDRDRARLGPHRLPGDARAARSRAAARSRSRRAGPSRTGSRRGRPSKLAAPSGVVKFEVVGLFKFSNGLDFGGEGFGTLPLPAARDAFDRPKAFDEVQVVVDERRRALDRGGPTAAWRPSSARASRSRRRSPRARTSRTSCRR